MLSFDEARDKLLERAEGLKPAYLARTQSIDLSQANGRVLAKSIYAPINVPPFDNSAMDGIAFNFEQAMASAVSGRCQLPITQRVLAGQNPEALAPNAACRIFTGAVIPQGADTVVLQEDCDFGGDVVSFDADFEFAQHIRCAGEDILQGTPVLEQGEVLTPRSIGLIASLGVTQVDVYQRLRVAVVSTGDELVSGGSQLERGKIYNSNGPMLKGLLEESGFEAHAFHVEDDLDAITAFLEKQSMCVDVMISIGGVSVGEADFVKQAIEALGELQMWKVAMKPGKPLAFGQVCGVPMIGLPGNPVSAFASWQLFAKPFLQRLQGDDSELNAAKERLPLELPQAMHPKRETFMRVQKVLERGVWCLKPFAHQGSGVLSSVAWASGFARIAMNETTLPHNEVEYWPFN